MIDFPSRCDSSAPSSAWDRISSKLCFTASQSDHERDLIVTPLVLGEIEYGMLRMPSGRKRTRLLEWFREGVRHL